MFVPGTSGEFETPVPSAARTTSGNTAMLVDTSALGTPRAIRAQLNVTAASGTTPTLDVAIQDSVDGVNWNTVASFTQATAVTRQVINIITATTPIAPYLRVTWTIGGTTPSFTFAVDWYADPK